MANRVIPIEWLPAGKPVHRVILHWTGGAYSVSGLDKQHYHFILDKEGDAVRGDRPLGQWPGHTRNLNSNSVGISAAAMAGAKEKGPYGDFPLLQVQYERAAQATADVVAAYNLAVNRRTVLCHQEVTYVYGPEATPAGPENRRQRGKWDVSELPWEPNRRPKEEIWQEFRGKVLWYLNTYHPEWGD